MGRPRRARDDVTSTDTYRRLIAARCLELSARGEDLLRLLVGGEDHRDVRLDERVVEARGQRARLVHAQQADRVLGRHALTVLGSMRRCSTAGSKTCRAGPWRRVSARELGGCKGSRARHVEMRERPHRHKTSSLIVS
jgi:hypothetical protein